MESTATLMMMMISPSVTNFKKAIYLTQCRGFSPFQPTVDRCRSPLEFPHLLCSSNHSPWPVPLIFNHYLGTLFFLVEGTFLKPSPVLSFFLIVLFYLFINLLIWVHSAPSRTLIYPSYPFIPHPFIHIFTTTRNEICT